MRAQPIMLGVCAATLTCLAACNQATEPMLTIIPTVTNGGSAGTGSPTLQVFPNAIQLPVGSSAQLSTNAPLALQNQVQWRALQPSIASVSTSGTVSAFSPGVATVIARYAFDTTQAASTTVTVIGPSIPSGNVRP